MIQRTLILIKPDGIKRALIGECICRFENVGLKIVGMKLVTPTEEFTQKHYGAHKEKHFFTNLVEYVANQPVVAIVLEGIGSVSLVRKIVGSTEPMAALPGTIRGDYAHHTYAYTDEKGKAIMNLIHASGTPEEAEQEIKLWFTNEELHNYKRADEDHIL